MCECKDSKCGNQTFKTGDWPLVLIVLALFLEIRLNNIPVPSSVSRVPSIQDIVPFCESDVYFIVQFIVYNDCSLTQ